MGRALYHVNLFLFATGSSMADCMEKLLLLSPTGWPQDTPGPICETEQGVRVPSCVLGLPFSQPCSLWACSATQSCPTLGKLMDCSLPGSSVHGIFQARILEWVAIAYSRDLPDPGTKSASPASPALAGEFFTTTPPAAAAKSLQLCPTLCDPRNGSLPGSSVPGILQARTLEWVAISFSNA